VWYNSVKTQGEGGKQVAESEAPEFLLFHVEDDRLKRLINRVWQRLPAHDRHVLCELLLQISDGMPDKDPEVLGSAGLIVPSSPMKGCVAQIARNASYSISLYRAKEIESDAACMFVIAHEFAHVVLRHGEMSVLAGFLQGFGPELIYTDSDMDTLYEWHEDHACLQAWSWGFQDELQAYLDACPEARRPRWHFEIEVEN
jgi:hypothetical protein